VSAHSNIGPLIPIRIDRILSWIRVAGQIALDYFGKVRADYKPDDTLQTRADVEIERFLLKEIGRAYPEHNLLAEETRPAERKTTSAYTWTIDPLDGTTAFVRGLPGWGISLGLLYRNRPIFGLFYMPLLDDLVYATPDQIYNNNEETVTYKVRSDWQDKGFLAVNAAAHQGYQIDLPRTRALGSIGANLVYTARGAATAAFVPRAYLWDLVAGAIILNRAGGELRYLSGQPVDYTALLDGRLIPEPIIAGHPGVLAELPGSIQPRGNVTVNE